MTPLVQARGLTCRFTLGNILSGRQTVSAVTDVDLLVNRGEILGLVGESGSGKSTIGRLLVGLLTPTRGEVLFDNQSLGASKANRRQMRKRAQIIFQDPYSTLDPKRRIGEQIADGLIFHKVTKSRAATQDRVEELLFAVGLEPEMAVRYPHQFSGGQMQRVAIARALAPGPDFLVADEAVSALDVSVQAQVIALLASLREKFGLTILFISHDLSVVRDLCDKVAVLYLGRVVEYGPTAKVFESPRHPYTTALLSSAPRMPGDESAKRIILEGDIPSPLSPPPGCVFSSRCPYSQVDCTASPPALEQIEKDWFRACIHDNSTRRL